MSVMTKLNVPSQRTYLIRGIKLDRRSHGARRYCKPIISPPFHDVCGKRFGSLFEMINAMIKLNVPSRHTYLIRVIEPACRLSYACCH